MLQMFHINLKHTHRIHILTIKLKPASPVWKIHLFNYKHLNISSVTPFYNNSRNSRQPFFEKKSKISWPINKKIVILRRITNGDVIRTP